MVKQKKVIICHCSSSTPQNDLKTALKGQTKWLDEEKEYVLKALVMEGF